MDYFLALCGIGLIVALVVQVWLSQSEDERAPWRAAGAELGLSVQLGDSATDRLIEGALHGHEIAVRVEYRFNHHWGERELHTIYELTYSAPLPFALRLSPKEPFIGVGLDDVRTGDPVLDRRVLVQAEDPAALRLWLSPERREHVRRFLLNHTEAQVDERGMRWAAPYLHIHSAEIVANVRRMVRAAEVFTAPSYPPPAEVERASRSRAVANRGRGPSPQTAPHDRWLDPLVVAAALFEGDPASEVAGERFEADFVDHAVAWRCALRGLEEVTVDHVFGDGPFIRVTLQLTFGGPGGAGMPPLSAVARLPLEAREGLRHRLEHVVTLRGRLVSFDPFAHTLFVDEGRIE
jgi:hypothetical protein